MAWVKRGSMMTPTYYLNRRDANGRVKTIYYGRGPWALDAAEAVERRKTNHQAMKQKAAELAVVDRIVAELDEGANVLLEAVLFAEGYHRQNYSKWRKRRGQGSQPTVIA